MTTISWTDKTWNPWQGCTRVSPGCANCYMFAEREGRFGAMGISCWHKQNGGRGRDKGGIMLDGEVHQEFPLLK